MKTIAVILFENRKIAKENVELINEFRG